MLIIKLCMCVEILDYFKTMSWQHNFIGAKETYLVCLLGDLYTFHKT
jgi:hypothetical protein